MRPVKQLLTVDADGTKSTNLVRARLDRVEYHRPASGPLDAGATAVVEFTQHGSTSVVVLNNVNLDADAVWLPRASVHDSAGTVISGQVGHHVLCDARIDVTITGGGSGTGEFMIVFET